MKPTKKSFDFTYVVYWENSPDCCKIGTTADPEKRFTQLLTAHHAPLIVLMMCDANVVSESSLHKEFEDKRITLEHFELTEKLKQRISKINLSTGFESYTISRHRTTGRSRKPGSDLRKKLNSIPAEIMLDRIVNIEPDSAMKCDTKGSSIHVRVPVEEKQLITELAARAGVKPSEFIRMSLRNSIDFIARASGAA